MTETLMVQEVAYILAVFLEGEWFLYLLSVLRNNSHKLEKNSTFLSSYFCPKQLE